MRRFLASLLLVGVYMAAVPADAATGKIVKVLPHFLDLKGQHTKSPSLFDRDAYQAWLRKHPEERSGMRFDIQWRAQGTTNTLKLRVEMRGIAEGHLPREKTIETQLQVGGGTSRWTALALKGDDYKSVGEITAWRVSLWEGDQLVAEQSSFLW